MRFYASSGDEARLTALLERGIVNVLATDKRGNQAVGYAKHYGHTAIVALLEEAMQQAIEEVCASAASKVILSGHTGLRANLMGEYKMEEERVNEYPLYKKAEEDHYIYRITKSGKWMVTGSRASVDKGAGSIMTQGPAQLPTSEGVTWQYWDGKKKKDVPDDAISANDVKVSIRYDT